MGRFSDGPILPSASIESAQILVYECEGFMTGPYDWPVELELLKKIDAAGNLAWSASGAPHPSFGRKTIGVIRSVTFGVPYRP
jgi:hypothetical protein